MKTEKEDAHAPSQAKRRMEAMTSSVDMKLAGAFSIILLLYAIITFGTWMHIDAQKITSPILHSVTAGNSYQETAPNHNSNLRLPKTPEQVQADQRHELEAEKAAIPLVKLEDITDIDTLQHTFPIHASHDLEEIDHPGVFMADKEAFEKIAEQHPDLPRDAKIQVPKFWRPVAYGPQGVREFLGQHGKRLITPEEASQIGSYYKDMETIYISVASYRDPECQPTVEDIFLRADHPERLRVAIIDQRAKDDPVPPCDKPTKPCWMNPEQVMCKYAHLIDAFPIDAPLSVGPVFARHLANRMYRGEYFAMQVCNNLLTFGVREGCILTPFVSCQHRLIRM